MASKTYTVRTEVLPRLEIRLRDLGLDYKVAIPDQRDADDQKALQVRVAFPSGHEARVDRAVTSLDN